MEFIMPFLSLVAKDSQVVLVLTYISILTLRFTYNSRNKYCEELLNEAACPESIQSKFMRPRFNRWQWLGINLLLIPIISFGFITTKLLTGASHLTVFFGTMAFLFFEHAYSRFSLKNEILKLQKQPKQLS